MKQETITTTVPTVPKKKSMKRYKSQGNLGKHDRIEPLRIPVRSRPRSFILSPRRKVKQSNSPPVSPLGSPTNSSISSSPYNLYHDSEGEGSNSSAKPTGFLGLVDCTMDAINMSECILMQYNILLEVFPDFPEAMMKTLLLRENGNGKRVAKDLIKRGWKPSSEQSLKNLSSEEADIFSVPYYWGKLVPEHVTLLLASPSGSYITSWSCKKNSFVICSINHNHHIVERETSSPSVQELQTMTYSLKYGLPRPKNIRVLDLAPFLGDL